MMTTETILAEQAIQDSISRFTAAWNLHDAAAFAQVFAEEADFTNVFGKKACGRTAIEQGHKAIFDTIFKESRLFAQEVTIRMIREDVAAVDVTWTMTGAFDFQGRPWNNRRGLMNLVMTPVADCWQIQVMHNMDLPAADLN